MTSQSEQPTRVSGLPYHTLLPITALPDSRCRQDCHWTLGHKGGDLIDGSAQDVRKIKLSVLILAKGTDLSIGVLE